MKQAWTLTFLALSLLAASTGAESPADSPLKEFSDRRLPPPGARLLVLGLPEAQAGSLAPEPELLSMGRAPPRRLPASAQALPEPLPPALPAAALPPAAERPLAPAPATGTIAAPTTVPLAPPTGPTAKNPSAPSPVRTPSPSPPSSASGGSNPPKPAAPSAGTGSGTTALAAQPAAGGNSSTIAPAAPTTGLTKSPTQPASPPTILPLTEPSPPPAAPRTLEVELGQKAELDFAGAGWTYLGERAGKEGIRYESRRFTETGVLFTLIPSKAGDYELSFQRQDALRGLAYDESVRLTVRPKGFLRTVHSPDSTTAPLEKGAPPSGEGLAGGASAPAASTNATSGGAAPASATAPSAAPPNAVSASAAANPGGRPSASGTAGPVAGIGASASAPAPGASLSGNAPSLPETAVPETSEGILGLARSALAAGKTAEALGALDRYLLLYPVGSDELHFLYGQAYEQNGPARDIRKAYAAYRKVRDSFPQSLFWDQAAARIAYIERFFLDIR